MTRNIWQRGLLVLSVILTSCSWAAAQAPKENAAPPAKAPKATPEPGEKAAGGPKPKLAKGDPDAAQPSGKAGAAAPAKPAVIDDPAVLAIVESKPTKPDELLRAALVLTQLGQPELAKTYLAQLIALKLDPEASAELVRQFGSAYFLQLARRDELKPEAQQFVDATLAAADARAHDPQQIAALIEQLTDPSADTRAVAIARLRGGQSTTAVRLIGTLADKAQAARHAAARDALTALGLDAVGPLLATLSSSDEALVAQAIDVLGRLQRSEAIAPLAGLSVASKSDVVRAAANKALNRITGQSTTPAQAQTLLDHQASEYYNRQHPLEAGRDGLVEIWQWDAEKKLPVLERRLPEVAAASQAARLADLLYQVAPTVRNRRFHLATLLELANYRAGLDQDQAKDLGAAYDEAVAAGPDAIEDILSYAIDTHHPVAASAAARILGEIGKPDLLQRGHGNACTLVSATQNPDRRLRFAALEAIVKLNPTHAYPGASFIPDALGYFGGSLGTRKALVVFPRMETAQQMVGLLNGLGFESDAATNGRAAFQQATSSPDYELILISSEIDHWIVETTVQQLRQDPRTAQVPIAILLEPHSALGIKEFADHEPLTLTIERPYEADAMKLLVSALQARSGTQAVPPDVRLRQASQSLGWMESLSKQTSLYDFRRQQRTLEQALEVAQFSPQAAMVLANFGTHDSQRMLVDVASRLTQSLRVRQSAVAAFGISVQHHGLQLTKEEILQQYDRYNHSEKLDPKTQEVLGAVLDWIETPSSE